MTITHDPEIQIAWPGMAAELGQFQILDYEIEDDIELDDGRIQSTYIYYVSTYDTGEWIIPPTGIAYKDSRDSTQILKTEPITITVKSILSDEDWAKIKAITEADTTYQGMEKQIGAARALELAKNELLKDINEPEKYPRGLRYWIGVAVIALILIALVIGFILWMKRRKQGKSIFSFSAPPLPPHEKALTDFAALKASQLINQGKFKEYYSLLSEILREYLENRIGVKALELSTSETMQNLYECQFTLSEDLLANVKEIMTRSDLVKFAKLIPQDDWHSETLFMAEDFVRETQPEEKTIETNETENLRELEVQENLDDDKNHNQKNAEESK